MAQKDPLPSEGGVYLQYVLGLWPGRRVPVYDVHRLEPGDMTGWQESDLTTVIDEGRRQLDRQHSDLEHIRGRAQFLFTTALGLLVVIFASVPSIVASLSLWAFLIWFVGALGTALGLLGAAAVTVARKDIGWIDTTRLSRQQSPIHRELAAAYARAVRTGENTMATHITVLRDAVFLVVVGAVAHAVAWLSVVLWG
ncbi:hypothetical protein ACIBF7_43130 [Nonomuraea sp. NPDC050478]|uniref:hypothetical protein n=1 Tax=Nonomuraea sp. NPDC050478 TaxID=3364365 RepID=UPI00378C79FB